MAVSEFNPKPGVAVEIAPGVRRILAPNPSPMTYRGTNTYLLGTDQVAIIDPGPSDESHLAAILSAIGSAKVQVIFVTHSHLDHSPLARELATKVSAPVLGFGESASGRSAIMQDLATAGLAGGGEGVDTLFRPDFLVGEGEVFANAEWQLEVLHTPGHMGNHIALVWGEAIFSGDLVMGWSSSLVSPPDGDLTDFMASCEKLKQRNPKILYPGHGAPIIDPIGRIDWLMGHRRERTAEIVGALTKGPMSVDALTKLVYADTAPELHPAASRNLFAHLVDLHHRNLVHAEPRLELGATFHLSTQAS